MTTISAIEPVSVTAGDRIQWTRDLGDYPASSWTISYVLLNSTGKITITGGADGDTHEVDVPAATSAAWAAGRYKWQGYVTNGATRITIGAGEIDVKPNFATATSFDTRSQVRRIFEAIEATIEGRASKDQQSYEILGRKLVNTPIEALLMLRDKYRGYVLQEENAERLANGKPSRNQLFTRFS